MLDNLKPTEQIDESLASLKEKKERLKNRKKVLDALLKDEKKKLQKMQSVNFPFLQT